MAIKHDWQLPIAYRFVVIQLHAGIEDPHRAGD